MNPSTRSLIFNRTPLTCDTCKYYKSAALEFLASKWKLETKVKKLEAQVRGLKLKYENK